MVVVTQAPRQNGVNIQMASKDKKLVQESVKVPNHGDAKIEDAKGE